MSTEIWQVCRSCASENQAESCSEINIRFASRIGLDKPAVLVFSNFALFRIGFTKFTFTEMVSNLPREGATA
jgi:hypothetical protein